ncbi:hypothetical protein RRG08_016944 [Elysia crispata]|uniref:Uncharacterized protein n=1 Tax=Elysia crispata TaxID=231223 RepID=A0AAE1A6E3_9GAST|nr:hypothetical protein RRG08_016944 [Elysia crispata]
MRDDDSGCPTRRQFTEHCLRLLPLSLFLQCCMHCRLLSQSPRCTWGIKPLLLPAGGCVDGRGNVTTHPPFPGYRREAQARVPCSFYLYLKIKEPRIHVVDVV